MEGPIKTNSLVLLAYLFSAQLGSLLEFTPDQISPVWPAAGVALAGVLLYGNGVVVGIFLAKLLHLWIGSGTALVWPEALLVCSGVALQALVGGVLVRRFAGFPNPLVSLFDVVRFLLWGGIVASCISASGGITVLWLYSHINQEELLFSWTTWWVGDAVGVFFVTPMLLAWLSPRVEQWKTRRWSMTLSMSVALLLLIGFSGSVRYWEGIRLANQFKHEAGDLHQLLTEFRDEQIGVLYSLRGFYRASEEVTREEFRAYVGPVLARNSGVQALSWNPIVSRQQRDAFEAEMQQQGFAGYLVTGRDPQGSVLIGEERDEYAPVAFIEPMFLNQRALGYDLYSSPERKQVLDLARRSGRVAASGVMTLAEGEQAGLMLSLPVSSGGASVDQLDGFVVSVLRLGFALESLLDNQLKPGMSYRLLDVTRSERLKQVRAFGLQPDQELDVQQRLADQLVHPVYEQLFEFEFAERNWILEVVADGRYLMANRHLPAWFLLLSGFLVACLVGVFVTLMTGRDYELRRLVVEQTTALRQREERLRMNQFALDHMAVGVYLINQLGRFVYANQTACSDLEYTQDEILNMDVADVNPCFDMSQWPAHWDKLKRDGMLQFETTHQSKHGRLLKVDVVANYFEYSGGGYNLAFVRDISGRKTREVELRKLSAAIEQSPVSVMITDLEGIIEYVNPALLRITGYSSEEVLGQNPRLFSSGRTAEAVYANMWRVLRSGGVWYGEFCNRCKDGSLIWESASITPVFDEAGVPSHYLAVKENITSSRRARERLRQSEQMLNRAQSLAHIGSWKLDFSTGKLYWSDETCRIFGLPPDSALDYQGFLRFVHPDDQERLDDAWLAALDGGEYDIEHRIIVAGEVKTVQQRAEFEFDAQGNAQRGIGTIHDVTERKRTDAALQDSELRYRSLVTALSEGVMLREANGRIATYNPAASQILGDTLQAMQCSGPGQGVVQLYRDNGEPLPGNEYPSMLTLATGEPCRDVVVGVERVEGGRIWLSVNTEPLCHKDQTKPYAVVISFQDITRRRQAEQDLKVLATTDALTGLLNRRACALGIEQELARCKRLPSHQCALLMMDLDHFKSINDRHGHAVGDLALIHFTKLLKSSQREIDTVGRWGGEEFVMLLPGTDLDGAKAYAERLREQLSESSVAGIGVELRLTVSIGVALLDPDDLYSDAALVRADGAMYRAKTEGRNRVITQQDLH
ncbi:MAG: PAS domain S-box protein [Halopseudomonas sp.]